MRMLHKEILTETQVSLLPTIQHFSKAFGLVGGTAVALQIGHRESVDFDLFPKDPTAEFDIPALRRSFSRKALLGEILKAKEGEFTFMTKTGVKVTFFDFEYAIPYTIAFERWIMIPNLLVLAAMKAFALGYRAKWKDYVDLYFVMRDFHSLSEIAARAKELFGGHFNEKLLRQQLSYFEDVSYKEKVTYKPGFEVSDEEVKKFLADASVA